MDTSGEDNENQICSEILLQKEDPHLGLHESKTNKLENKLSAFAEEASGELLKRQSQDFSPHTSQTDQAKSNVPLTCENVSFYMQRGQKDDGICGSQVDEEKVHSCAVPEKEMGNLQQKARSETGSLKLGSSQVSAALKNVPDSLDLKQRAHSGNHPSESCEGAIFVSRGHARQSSQDSIRHKEELESLKQEEILDDGIHTSVSSEKPFPDSGIGVSQCSELSIVPKIEKDVSELRQSSDAQTNSSAPYEGTSIVVEKASNTNLHRQSTNIGISASPGDQVKSTYSDRPEKTLYKLQPRRNPDSGVNLSQSEHGSTSSKMPEKTLDDGYNWRKYGQKLVRGNVFVRSYYKCTYANCRAKKQVERPFDGPLTDIRYIGKHEHPKAQNIPHISGFLSPTEVRRADLPVMAKSEADAEPFVAHPKTTQPAEPTQPPRQPTTVTSNDVMGSAVSQLGNSPDDVDSDASPNLKKQKREISTVDDNLVKKTYCESRHVVQTISEVDIVNDGYRWRKYGQKLVKGNPNPRSYYRCSNAGCSVKKHVERASHDPKVVITTYEGKHDHDMPASRTISHSATRSDPNRKTVNGEPRSELGERKPVGLDRAVHIGAN